MVAKWPVPAWRSSPVLGTSSLLDSALIRCRYLVYLIHCSASSRMRISLYGAGMLLVFQYFHTYSDPFWPIKVLVSGTLWASSFQDESPESYLAALGCGDSVRPPCYPHGSTHLLRICHCNRVLQTAHFALMVVFLYNTLIESFGDLVGQNVITV